MQSMKVKRTQVVEVPQLGDRIRQERKASKKTVDDLAELAGISRQHWYDIENEAIRDSVPEETLRRIEKALGIDLGISFGDSQP